MYIYIYGQIEAIMCCSTTVITHRDKVRSSKVPDDTGGSADSHVANEWEQPSEENKQTKFITQHESGIVDVFGDEALTECEMYKALIELIVVRE